MPKMIDSLTTGESKCKAASDYNIWFSGPQNNCGVAATTTTETRPVDTTTKPPEPTTTKPVEPTTTSNIPEPSTTKPPEPSTTTKPPEPTTTKPALPDCSNYDKCTCYKYEYCGLCAMSTGYSCINRVNPISAESGYGETKCKSATGTWSIGVAANICAATTTSTTKPPTTTNPVETKPVEPTCSSYSDNLCSCTKMDTCGMCFLSWRTTDGKNMTAKKCVNKLYSNTENGEAWCKRELGVWKVGVQAECTPGSFYEAEVKGTVTGTVTDATKTTIEQVVTKIVSDQLGIDATKVDVTVDTTTNADGTTTFKVAVKVGTTEVTTDKFSDISKISTTTLESQLAANGITAQSGTVNIQNNFAGKLFISFLVVAVLSLLF
jgi:hypothetical protein